MGPAPFMRELATFAGVGLALLSTPGCLDKIDQGPSGPRLQIEVAPLTLDGIVEATYTITVHNAQGEAVWSAGPLASTRFGDGKGALTYIGPCDASDGANPHTVELVLESLTGQGGPLVSPGDYVNPTIEADGTRVPVRVTGVVCRENADTPVVFDLTILRRAQQGFFDFAIEFDDIFCSAKLDCAPSLLHRPDGSRGPTAIVAFACSGGKGDRTYMYSSDLVLSCPAPAGSGEGDIALTVPMAAASPGQHPGIAPGIYAWAVYAGREFLAQTDLEKCYRNVAVGLDTDALDGRSCTLSAIGTASDTPLEAATPPATGYRIPAGAGAYPYVRWSAEVLSAGGALCDNYALDDTTHAGVSTGYVKTPAEAAALAPLTEAMTCGDRPPVVCSDTSPFGAIAASASDGGFELGAADGTVARAAFTLPEGYDLADSCCTAGCCDGPRELTCQQGGDFGDISVRGTGAGFSLVATAGGVADRAFTLPAGHTLGTACCAHGCCQGAVFCDESDAVGTIAARPTALGFALSAEDGGVPPLELTLPEGYSLARQCSTHACCRSD